MYREKKGVSSNTFVLATEGDDDVLFNFQDKPYKRKGSDTYYFDFTFKDPRTGKYCHSRISTKETVYRSAKKKRDALKERINKKVFAEEIRQSDKQPISEFFESFLLAKEQEHKSEKTVSDYRLRLFSFVKYADPSLPLSNVTTEMLRAYLHTIRSESTRHLTYRTLRTALNFAVREEKLERNPILRVNLPRQAEPIRDYLKEPEFWKLYERMPEESYTQICAKAASLIAFAVGPRLGEICHIRLKSIRSDRNELLITNSESFRTKNRTERPVPINPLVREALEMQLRNKASHPSETVRESQYLFSNEAGKPFTTLKEKSCKLSRFFLRARREVYPDREGLHFHSLRHSFGQNAYNANVPLVQISKIMGHKSVSVTARYYARQTDYKNLSAMYEYLNKQPVGKPSQGHGPFIGSINREEITECVLSDTTQLVSLSN